MCSALGILMFLGEAGRDVAEKKLTGLAFDGAKHPMDPMGSRRACERRSTSTSARRHKTSARVLSGARNRYPKWEQGRQ